MYYKTQPGGTYGVGLGNSGAIAGIDLPFGGGGRYKTIQEQNKPGAPRDYIPIRTYPQNEPGREGAIDVKFRQAMFGGPLLAQSLPPMGNAGALGGMMEMGPRFGQKPLNIDINAVDDRLESVGGSANIQLDRDQMLRLGGSFNPGFTDQMGIQNPQGYQVYGEYTTPSLGVNVNYRNTRGNPSALGGFPGEVQAGFKGRF